MLRRHSRSWRGAWPDGGREGCRTRSRCQSPMAITTRTDRAIGAWVHSETPDRVGPGAYDVDPKFEDYHEVIVPFDSGVPRKSLFDIDNKGPGPATYMVENYSPTNANKMSCRSVFESKVDRFDCAPSSTPGPGLYDVRPSWVKSRSPSVSSPKPISAPLGSSMELIRDNNQLAIVFGPSGSKPSIPSQSKTVRAAILSPPAKPPPKGFDMSRSLPRQDLYPSLGIGRKETNSAISSELGRIENGYDLGFNTDTILKRSHLSKKTRNYNKWKYFVRYKQQTAYICLCI